MHSKNYVNVTISVLEEDYEIAYGILTSFEFLGMEEKLDEIVLSFEEKNWNDDVKNDLESKFNKFLPKAKVDKIEIISEKNWNKEWEKNVPAVQISENIGIAPEWKANDLHTKLKILINPKMSFGTGQHSTTKLMITMLEKVVKSGQTWIDAGTGTGILAIVIAKLGAKKVYAFDNDDWAYDNAIENVELNNVKEIVEVQKAEIESYQFPKVDCISANMFLNLLDISFPKFYTALKDGLGILLVSGILAFDREELLRNATQNGFILKNEVQEMEWYCFEFEAKK